MINYSAFGRGVNTFLSAYSAFSTLVLSNAH